jgi:Gpi18-like mannosyltransferase
VAEALLAGGPFALYTQTAGIYPYPPPWAAIEAAALWLQLTFGLDFSLIVRVPAIAADIGIVYVLWRWGGQLWPRAAFWRSLFYALNPIALIITCLHGQFDAIPALFSLLAIYWATTGSKSTLSALSLAAAIAFKSYPILLLIPILLTRPTWRARLEYAVIALAPVALLLLPFVMSNAEAVFRELAGYRGAALLGLLVPLRTVYVPLAGDSFPVDWTVSIIQVSAGVFLVAYAALIVYQYRTRLPLVSASVCVLAGFYVLYAGIAPQYLVWLVPLLLVASPPRWWPSAVFAATGTAALAGFYIYAVPETLPVSVSLPLIATQLLYGVTGSVWWLSGWLLLWHAARRAREHVSM